MTTDELGADFPRILRAVWAMSDPSSRSHRVCDALDRQTIHQKFRTLNGDYWICSRTGQMSRERELSDAQLLESYELHWKNMIAGDKHGNHRIAGYSRWLSRFEPYRRTGRLFEVGSGLGAFLGAAVGAGWKAEGNELSAVAAEFANHRTGVHVIPGPMEAVHLEQGVYDVVLCNNVFEHLLEPRRVLCNLAQSLRAGGVIYFQTLNCQSLSVWCEPRGWLYFAEGHTCIPTIVSLDHYFRQAGLTVVSRKTHGFRWAPRGLNADRPKLTRVEKLLSLIAARMGLGHRVKCILQRPMEAGGGRGAEGGSGPLS